MKCLFDSNHDRCANSHVMRFLERHEVPYHYLNTTIDDKNEGDILNVVKDTDFLVLARYMQVSRLHYIKCRCNM